VDRAAAPLSEAGTAARAAAPLSEAGTAARAAAARRRSSQKRFSGPWAKATCVTK